MLSSLTTRVLARPRLVIAVTALLTLAASFGMRFLQSDTDVTRVLPDNLPEKALYDRMGEIFPSKEMVIIAIEGANLEDAATIQRLDRLTRRIEQLPRIDAVLSPTNAKIIRSEQGELIIRNAADPVPMTGLQALNFHQSLKDQPLLQDVLIKGDNSAIALLVFIKKSAREADAAQGIIELARDEKRNEGFVLNVTGRPAGTYWSRVVMGRDMGMLTTGALIMIVSLLFFTFRSLRGLVLPVGVAVISTLWTFGLMGYAGIPFTHSIEVLPILLLAIGVADGVHILKGYYQRARTHNDRAGIVSATMQDLTRPVILTSVTTMIGFLALNTSGIVSIMTLGWLTAFGILVALVLSLTLLPALLAELPLPKGKPGGTNANRRKQFTHLEHLAQRWGQLLVKKKKPVLWTTLLIMALAAFGATRVHLEFSTTSNFNAKHPFRIADEVVKKHFASSTNLAIIVEGKEADALKDPLLLQRINELELWLKRQPHVGTVQSITGYIKQMHRVMQGGDIHDYRLPGDVELIEVRDEGRLPTTVSVPGKELIAQYLALYEMSGKPGDFANLITYDYATARINVFIDSDKASVVAQLQDDIKLYLQQNMAETSVVMTGMAALLRAVNDLVVTGQAWSILTSLGLVLLVTALMFRSPSIGIYCTLPLFFALAFNFGFMGLTGIPLSVETMATSSVAIGAGIDYAIHFVHRYQHDRLSGMSYPASAIHALQGSGVAIFVNAMTVAAGFLVLVLSGFQGVKYLGLLIALTMITSAFAALTLLPILFATLKPRVFKTKKAKS